MHRQRGAGRAAIGTWLMVDLCPPQRYTPPPPCTGPHVTSAVVITLMFRTPAGEHANAAFRNCHCTGLHAHLHLICTQLLYNATGDAVNQCKDAINDLNLQAGTAFECRCAVYGQNCESLLKV